MKKIILFAIFVAISTVASAQFILGGQFNVSSISSKDKGSGGTDESTTTMIGLMPRLAFSSGNLWYGVDAGVNLMKEKDDYGVGTFEHKSTVFSIAPFIRSTKRPTENFGIWIEGQAGASFGNEKNDNGDKTVEYSGFNVGVRPGVIFFIGDHLSFEASFGRLGYTSFTAKDPDNRDNKEIISQVGLILNNNSLLLDGSTFNITSGFQFGANWSF